MKLDVTKMSKRKNSPCVSPNRNKEILTASEDESFLRKQ